MIAIFWNCRELGYPATIRVLRELCNSDRPNLLFLLETKICNTLQIQSIARGIHFDHVHAVPANGSSGGLAISWKQDLDLHVVTSSSNFISIMVLNNLTEHPWQLTSVYGPPNLLLKPSFWEDLKRIGDSFYGPWCVVGDFNAIMEQ